VVCRVVVMCRAETFRTRLYSPVVPRIVSQGDRARSINFFASG
jgi:hypothetical protein